MAEELGLEELGGDGRAVDGNERPLAAVALLMNGTCQHLFAGSAFAAQSTVALLSPMRATRS